ncbi:hypothetical protein SAMN05421736_11551 [Evansella caseinilytica]|uniref:DUF4064 domain-containing protein n=1 Tax=Evansella caseinilytica TaxID=1503961 RepID=A0A1H3TKK5_9BACI|nr:hypothetical protein [Evansella caseinilytica]SDZ50813.1 hypothetical protein SAMN05421736_11551 [Evansella caseinilytica]
MELNKHLLAARLLVIIGSIIFFVLSFLLLLISMVASVEVTINGDSVSGTIWELVEYPAHFSFWISVIVVMLGFGITGLVIRKKAEKNPTTAQMVILIILGIPTIVALGAGVLFIIAGVQIYLAKKVKELEASYSDRVAE